MTIFVRKSLLISVLLFTTAIAIRNPIRIHQNMNLFFFQPDRDFFGSGENIHGSIFTGRPGIRFCDQNRIAIDPDWFLIAIMIAIAVLKSGSDYEMKIADRFCDQNR
jgi:hypothetical protein